jgi:hypothetical protein
MVNLPSEVKRRVLCSRYSECLEICISKGWRGFSCSECQDFELECPGDATHWAEQGENAGWLLMSAGYFPKWIANKVRDLNELEDFIAV